MSSKVGDFFQIFVAFSEYLNCTQHDKSVMGWFFLFLFFKLAIPLHKDMILIEWLPINSGW